MSREFKVANCRMGRITCLKVYAIEKISCNLLRHLGKIPKTWKMQKRAIVTLSSKKTLRNFFFFREESVTKVSGFLSKFLRHFLPATFSSFEVCPTEKFHPEIIFKFVT